MIEDVIESFNENPILTKKNKIDIQPIFFLISWKHPSETSDGFF